MHDVWHAEPDHDKHDKSWKPGKICRAGFRMQLIWTRSTDLTADIPVSANAENILGLLGDILILNAKVYHGKRLIYLGKFTNNVEATLPQTNGGCRVLSGTPESIFLNFFLLFSVSGTRQNTFICLTRWFWSYGQLKTGITWKLWKKIKENFSFGHCR